eukprot:Colp12_sorted_trinity150504_noHs@21602
MGKEEEAKQPDASKQKQQQGKKKKLSVPNREAYERLNFLYQASHLTLGSNAPSKVELSRFYNHTFKTVCKKLVLKIDPKVKRSMCKKCSALLMPGVTSTVRVSGSKPTRTVVTCNSCQHRKEFVNDPKHELWTETAVSAVQESGGQP